MRYWLVGIVLGLLSPYLFAASSEPAQVYYYKDYARQAVQDIAIIEAAYDAVRMYHDGKQSQTDAKAASGKLGDLIDRLNAEPAPLPTTAIQEQIVFAAKRCQNYSIKIGWLTPEEKANVFVGVAEIQLREFCAVQIHAAKMRLIDYGVANGVNPYE